MILGQPFWLLLLIPLIAALRVLRGGSGLADGLRTAALVVAVLALASPAILKDRGRGVVVSVVDRSRSMPDGSDGAALETLQIMSKGRPESAHMGVVTYGSRPMVELSPQKGLTTQFVKNPDPDGSNLSAAIRRALTLTPENGSGRLLIVSDGDWTGEDPALAATEAAARGIALDFRYLGASPVDDLAIGQITAPERVGPNEGFMITAWADAPRDGQARVELLRSGQVLSAYAVDIKKGRNRLVFRDLAGDAGVLSYQLKVNWLDGQDSVLENNQARFLVGVRGSRAILHVSPSGDTSLGKLLQANGLRVDSRKPENCDWSLAGLSNYAALILENTPASSLGLDTMNRISLWVTETGSGLMMTGGMNSFGPGGYFKSPLEEIMPVTMELRQEHRKLTLAIVVALDRSGSMSATTTSGRVKMDLANLASVEVIDILSDMDQMGALAVDTEAHVVSPMVTLDQRAALRSRILRIESSGGGIYVYQALGHSVDMLNDVEAGARHIILFADAADAEQPGDYKRLLQMSSASGITVSVVGLGTELDMDAEFLKDVAKRGGGQIYFTTDPEDLPRIFAQDTFVVARSTFIEETTPIRLTSAMLSLASKPFGDAPPTGGYNLTYLHPQAQLAAVTEDEYQAPLIAWRFSGSGRVLAFTGEVGGNFAGELAQWESLPDLLTALARWTSGSADALPGGGVLTQRVIDGQIEVSLHLDPDRAREMFNEIPQLRVLRGKSGQTPTSESHVMRWSAPDRLTTRLDLNGGETILPALNLDGGSFSLSPVRLPYSPEFLPPEPGKGREALERLARITGGKERLQLDRIWADLPEKPTQIPLRNWLLIGAVILMLLHVYERRTAGISIWRSNRTSATTDESNTAEVRPIKIDEQPSTNDAKPSQPEPKAEPPSSGISSALGKAADRARQRTKR